MPDRAPMASNPPFSLVFVLGVAHCGSTLLGRLLNGHSRVLCVGELMRVDLALAGGLPCGCGAQLPACEFWGPRLERIRAASGNDYTRFDPELYAGLGDSVGADVVVDLSKTRAWRATRRWRRADVGHVLLLRDSRGILASAARVGKPLDGPLRKHEKWVKRLHRFVKRQGERGLVVRYEDLCARPEEELRRLCSFLGLDPEPAMLTPADRVHHFVHSSSSGYLRNSNELRRDERWKEELEPASIARIEAVMRRVPVLSESYLR